ncbi:flagellar biosynthetic protein FliR [Candidatus Aerophobetes bacterium]|uniref:Flagellar biosynthetic protein FliR n=1 Tax=Aerophobetes bacterium TaxID=2030807 RepID=A0A497E2D7_UNCAE|nr:MAG: flagellar biosynthetic protein FliR [Candidatus Aerophobetes bacterium]
MDLLTFLSPEKIKVFVLVLARVSGAVMTIPVLGSNLVPRQVKAAISLFLTLLLFPVVARTQVVSLSMEWIGWAVEIARELTVGVVLGYSVRFLFTGIELAGQIIGFQMGLSIANVMGAQSQDQLPIISEFKNLMAVMIFLSLNAHHYFLKGMADSFTLVPLASFSPQLPLIRRLILLTGNIFILSLKIGAPIIVVLLLTEIALGIIARLVPQMNVFIVALPLRIGVGLLMIAFSLPFFLYLAKGLFFNLYREILILLYAMRG